MGLAGTMQCALEPLKIYFSVMGRLIAVLLLAVSALSCSHGQSNNDLWMSASQHYANADYRDALMNYRIIEGELASSELYFNLGNCYFQLDSVAQSILYFEKAIKLNPRDHMARENLKLVMSRVDDPISAIDEFFLKRWANGMSDIMPPVAWGLICLIFLWFAMWMLVKSLKRNTLRRDRLSYTLPVGAFIFCFIGGYIAIQNRTDSDYAIVMEALEVKVAPDELSATTRSIAAGEKILIIDKLDDYYKVRFVNYEHGWLPKTTVRRI